MKTKFILLLVIFIGFSSLAKCNEMETDTTAMANLIKEIIDLPANMVQTMSNSKHIDCTELVTRFREDKVSLERFDANITRIKCEDFRYLGIDVSANNIYDKIFILYYVKNGGYTGKDMIKFLFAKKDNKILFRGITGTID